MAEHASSHLIGDDFQPLNTTERLLYAILIEERAANAARDGAIPSRTSPAAPRRDTSPVPHATAAPLTRKDQEKYRAETAMLPKAPPRNPPRVPQGPPPTRPMDTT